MLLPSRLFLPVILLRAIPAEGSDTVQGVIRNFDKESRTTSARLRELVQVAYNDHSQTSIPDIWTGPDLFHWVDGSRIPSMSVVSCKFLFLLGLAMTSDEEVAVEFGTWVGHSSSCLAAGLLSTGKPGRLHCFDLFEMTVNSHKLNATFWHGWSKKDGKRVGTGIGGVPPLLPIFISIVHRIDPFVTTHIGDMQRHDVSSPAMWGDKKVGVFAIDSAKSWKQVIAQTGNGLWANIGVGSVIVMMDFAKHACQILSFYILLVTPGFVDNEYIAFAASPWAFSVSKPISHEYLQTYTSIILSSERLTLLANARNLILRDIHRASSRQHPTQDEISDVVKMVLKQVDKCAANSRFCFA